MKLHGYYRSSASYRVRIALNLKNLHPDTAYVHLSRNGGEQFTPAFSSLNPQHLLPVLEDGGAVLTQSLAIIEYLDETQEGQKLLPADALGRARVRQLAMVCACDIHPLNNLRVLNYLTGPLALSQAQKNAWYQHWTNLGLAALEAELANSPHTGLFCHGDTPTLADCCLVPQVYNALRFQCDLAPYPTIRRIVAHCEALPAFREAHPDAQPDAE
ncbi:maleylacetoacetate isomerase [Janthinobacterium sp. BJB426]|uniref:maleylacetoacetate isomerase n=1 Tax=Janthinobacterium sp. BJB426 TaxID=2048010 RepID=UPI000C0F6425|nr:maleylacetoacetate isomerase [Janthinobacterium sp. BJB426]PHV28848.1 maleylacetoacetate isomerase [Janthinobacterium sp. BJB426]